MKTKEEEGEHALSTLDYEAFIAAATALRSLRRLARLTNSDAMQRALEVLSHEVHVSWDRFAMMQSSKREG